MNENLVSVVMCQYNTPERYLREAIESVLNQTYTDFEFIIVDDGSSDGSIDVIRSYSDRRILLIENEHNGIAKALNIGLEHASGAFVARMDSDDVCMPDRFEMQVNYLRSHKECIVCGSYAEFIGNRFEKTKSGLYLVDIPSREEFRIRLLFSNYPTILHSAAMFQHRMLRDHHICYDERYTYVQDYQMWIDCSRIAECANCPQILMKIRRHDASTSHRNAAERDVLKQQIINEQIKPLEISLPDNWKEIHWGCLNHPLTEESMAWLETIVRQNRIHRLYDPELLERLVFYH